MWGADSCAAESKEIASADASPFEFMDSALYLAIHPSIIGI